MPLPQHPHTRLLLRARQPAAQQATQGQLSTRQRRSSIWPAQRVWGEAHAPSQFGYNAKVPWYMCITPYRIHKGTGRSAKNTVKKRLLVMNNRKNTGGELRSPCKHERIRMILMFIGSSCMTSFISVWSRSRMRENCGTFEIGGWSRDGTYAKKHHASRPSV